MTPAGVEQLKHDEGLRLKPYRCTADKLTIGYGRNLDDVGISADEAEYLFANDIKEAESELRHTFPWFEELTAVRQDVLVNMRFNLGLTRLLGFKKFLKAVELGNYETAADEMLSSFWAEQVGDRAKRLAHLMRGSEEV